MSISTFATSELRSANRSMGRMRTRPRWLKKVAIGRAVRLSPWAWAKRVGAHEGQRLRLSLGGIGGVDQDIVMRGGKAWSRLKTAAPMPWSTGSRAGISPGCQRSPCARCRREVV